MWDVQAIWSIPTSFLRPPRQKSERIDTLTPDQRENSPPQLTVFRHIVIPKDITIETLETFMALRDTASVLANRFELTVDEDCASGI